MHMAVVGMLALSAGILIASASTEYRLVPDTFTPDGRSARQQNSKRVICLAKAKKEKECASDLVILNSKGDG